jgi:hypothetical protein
MMHSPNAVGGTHAAEAMAIVKDVASALRSLG